MEFSRCSQSANSIYVHLKKPKEMGSKLMICGQVYCLKGSSDDRSVYHCLIVFSSGRIKMYTFDNFNITKQLYTLQTDQVTN